MYAASPDLESDLAACRRAIREGSKSFYAASLLLPPDVRSGAYALYAFCRCSDDIIDRDRGDARAIARLQERLEKAYLGKPEDCFVDRAFAEIVARHAIPKALPAALIEGLAWDAAGRRYPTLETLYDYCARVAGSVGAMMAVLMGVREKLAIARACDLGVAMQMTNIARDVGEDARAGRIYLPLDWLAEARVDGDRFVAEPAFSLAIGGVVRRVLDHADVYYQRGLAGIDHLPMECRAAIVAAADIYADIGRVIAANGFDSVTQRAVVPTRRKLMLVANAVAGLNFSSNRVTAGPLRATAFLVNAVDPSVAHVRSAPAGPAEQVLDLIMKLERRDRALVDAAT